MPCKPITESRTFWFNVAMAVLTALLDHSDTLRPYLSDGGFALLIGVLTGGNVYLRSITSSAVRFGK